VQVVILQNHQNGKDTHLRGIKIFAPGTEYSNHAEISMMDGPLLDEAEGRYFSVR
jgi:Anaphase-promoting complex, subunit 10 (APC10)